MVVAWLGYIVEVLRGGERDKERSLHVARVFGFLVLGSVSTGLGLCIIGGDEEERRRVFFLVFSSDDYGV